MAKASKAPVKKPSAPRKRAVKVVPDVEKEPEVKADETTATIPAIENKEIVVKGWMPWAFIGAVVVVLFLLIRGCNHREELQQDKQVTDSLTTIERLKAANDSLGVVLNFQDSVFIRLLHAADDATEERKAIETDGEQKRIIFKKNADEIKQKLANPHLTDAERDRIADELLRARQALKVSHND